MILVTGSSDTTVKLFDLIGNPIHTFDTHKRRSPLAHSYHAIIYIYIYRERERERERESLAFGSLLFFFNLTNELLLFHYWVICTQEGRSFPSWLEPPE